MRRDESHITKRVMGTNVWSTARHVIHLQYDISANALDIIRAVQSR
jgi:hypothetical protein